MIIVIGRIGNKKLTLQWEKGALTGNAAAVSTARSLVARGVDVCGTPTGPCERARLDTLPAALWTMYAVFDEVLSVEGITESVESIDIALRNVVY